MRELLVMGSAGHEVNCRCDTCGASLDQWDRQMRFRLPDPVLGLSDPERTDRTWGNDVLMQVQGVGAFVRCLLPVALTEGYSVTFGLWLGVNPSDLQRAYEVWTEPEYQDLALNGFVANSVPPWGRELLAAPASAVVRDIDHVPYVIGSDHPLLSRVIGEVWPHDDILSALPA